MFHHTVFTLISGCRLVEKRDLLGYADRLLKHIVTFEQHYCGLLRSILSTVVFVDSFDAVSYTFYSPI